jgi:hypothetical protein
LKNIRRSGSSAKSPCLITGELTIYLSKVHEIGMNREKKHGIKFKCGVPVLMFINMTKLGIG